MLKLHIRDLKKGKCVSINMLHVLSFWETDNKRDILCENNK